MGKINVLTIMAIVIGVLMALNGFTLLWIAVAVLVVVWLIRKLGSSTTSHSDGIYIDASNSQDSDNNCDSSSDSSSDSGCDGGGGGD